MGPIRREQICRAAATVISREGFAGTTMRLVAEEAGVSTGMLNHYFENRLDLLTKALVFVSERTERQLQAAIAELPPGRERLAALLDSVLAEDEQTAETWRVWVNSYGEAVRLPELRSTIASQLSNWFALIDSAMEGLVEPAAPGSIPWSWRVDAVMNGLAIRALTSDAGLDAGRIRREVMQLVLGSDAAETRAAP